VTGGRTDGHADDRYPRTVHSKLCCMTPLQQESLADAKVSARQQCMYEGPLAKKSTANQRYEISSWCLIVTLAALLTVCEIFSCVEVENRHFRLLHSDCRPVAEERPANINVIYASLRNTFSGLQFCRWQYRSIFIRLVLVASQICEITGNSEKIRT